MIAALALLALVGAWAVAHRAFRRPDANYVGTPPAPAVVAARLATLRLTTLTHALGRVGAVAAEAQRHLVKLRPLLAAFVESDG